MADYPESAEIAQILQDHVLRPAVAPAAAAGYISVAGNGERAVGAAGRLPQGPGGATVDATSTTLFDLASVSKPIVACTLARLVARGVVAFETPLGSVLPEARGTASEHAPLELLLAHRAGLEAHRPLFAPVLTGAPLRRARALRAAADARRPECVGAAPRAGFGPVYSDLGYVLLGAAIEAVTAEPLDAVIEREVAVPLELGLGSARRVRLRRADFGASVAPTETVRARGGRLRGVVHDENAWALSGHAASGHAGVFGTVGDVLGFGAALLEALSGRSSWLPGGLLARLIEPRAGGSLRAGFDGKSAEGSSAGSLASPAAFGHLGFTGTSLWCDPMAGAATVLLTNRVCPTRDNPRIRAARPAVHDALFRAARPVLPSAPNP
jgi:CubicO group peptidase (beta-lactamase class C family)